MLRVIGEKTHDISNILTIKEIEKDRKIESLKQEISNLREKNRLLNDLCETQKVLINSIKKETLTPLAAETLALYGKRE